MKKLLFFIVILGLFFVSCDKEKNDPKNPVFKIENQDQLISVLNDAINAANDPNVTSITLDMRTLKRMIVGGENSTALESAIQQLTDAAVQFGKTLIVQLPELYVAGPARISGPFVTAVAGTIIVGADGQLHIVGELPWDMFINVNVEEFINNARRLPPQNAPGLRRAPARKGGEGIPEIYPITVDKININTSGMSSGAGAIFDIMKPDTLSATQAQSPFGWQNVLGPSIFGRTRSDRKTPVINAQYLRFNNIGDHEFRQMEFATLDENNPDATLSFKTPPHFWNARTDTIRMGVEWNNGVATPVAGAWGHRLRESHFLHNGSNSAYRIDPINGEYMVIKLPYYIPGVNDSAFYNDNGVMRAFVTVEEMTELLRVRVYGGKIYLSSPAAMKVPADEHGNLIRPSQFYTGTIAARDWVEFYTNNGLDVNGTNNLLQVKTHDLKINTRQ